MRPHEADPRKFVLYELSKSVRPVPGDTAECGVYRGMSSLVILAGTANPAKRHCVFDSFQGLSEPGSTDTVSDGKVLRWKNAELYAGWIPDRFDDVADRRFSLVHIDVDLYQPTLDSALFFLPRINPGGVLICDDYGFASCPGARPAMDESARRLDLRIMQLPTGQGIIFIG